MKKKLLCLCALFAVLVSCLFPATVVYGSEYVPWTHEEESVTYTRVEEEEYMLDRGFPCYGRFDTLLSDACGPIAATNILVYLDRYYPNIVPDHQGYMTDTGYAYMWYDVEDLISDLATRMKLAEGGVSLINFKRGLGAYLKETGYTFGYRDVVADGKFYYNYYAEYIDAGYPVALFFSKVNEIDWTDNGNVRTFSKKWRSVNHVMAAFGYRTAKFYRTVNGVETLVRSDTYLLVSNGYGSNNYVIVDDTLTLDEGFAVRMHEI